jgi:hypothetical protein
VTKELFDQLDAQLAKAANDVLDSRRDAYAKTGDVLANFKEIAGATGLPIEKVWEVYFRKALNAAIKVVGGGNFPGEPRTERMVDLYNYVRLGWAIANIGRTVVEKLPFPAVGTMTPGHPDYLGSAGLNTQHARNRYVD